MSMLISGHITYGYTITFEIKWKWRQTSNSAILFFFYYL